MNYKYAADFRAIARDALRGKWIVAVLTGFVASLMGAGVANSGGGTGSSGNQNDTYRSIYYELQHSEFWPLIQTLLIVAIVALVIWLIVMLVIGGAGKLGYAKFNLNLVDKKEALFSDLFSRFDRLGDGFCMNFLTGLYIGLWSLLFIIPGIVKSFSYAMTPYILTEHPEMSANEAITESRRIMAGNRWRLFCLDLSFIGWDLLCAAPVLVAVMCMTALAFAARNPLLILLAFPLAIPLSAGTLFLRPYREAAHAAFYREISGTWTPTPPPPYGAAGGYSETV